MLRVTGIFAVRNSGRGTDERVEAHFSCRPTIGRRATSREAIARWSRASKPASRTRRCSASPARARPSRSPTSSSAVQRPTLVLAHNKTLAAQLYGEFKEFFPRQRGRVLRLLLRLLPARGLRAVVRHLHREGRLDQRAHRADAAVGDQGAARAAGLDHRRDGLGDLRPRRSRRPTSRWCCTWCAATASTSASCCGGSPTCSTRATNSTCAQGTYRVRGDVIDIFPAESEREAVRVELFDDEIESLAFFDPLTGEVLRKVPRLTVFPSTHYVTPRERLLASGRRDQGRAARAAAELRGANKLVEAQRLEQRTLFDLEMIAELGYCTGIENYSRYLSGRDAGRAAAVPVRLPAAECAAGRRREPRDDSADRGMYNGDRSRKETLVEYGFRLPSALDNRPLRFDEWERVAPQMIFVSATPAVARAGEGRPGRRAGRAADRPRRSRGRGAAGRDAGRRRAVGDPDRASSAASACWSRR